MSRKTRTDRGGARGRSRRTKLLINSFLVGALALTVGGTWWFLHPSSAQDDSTVTVRTATATVGTVSTTISAQSTIAAATTSSPSFAVSGTVATVDVKVGDVVTAGQQLGTLDPSALAAAVTTARAQVASAKAQVTTAGFQLTERPNSR